ncbi:YHS domain-containing (seleno)protein [Marinomonas polaris]|uniref:YHS domain-containing (seleno)protein n=1 Tax=Marinomonas polaris TaxID=293552 RepID=UPI003512965C
MTRLMMFFALFISSLAFAQDEIYTGYFSNKALSGYDTVAYFTDQKPVEGSAKYVTEYKGADWYFASQQHLDMFKTEPEKYAPQYGGYCAWAVSAKNDFASADPKDWAVVDGKLYLNYDDDIKRKWDQDPALHIKQADANWPTLIGKP